LYLAICSSVKSSAETFFEEVVEHPEMTRTQKERESKNIFFIAIKLKLIFQFTYKKAGDKHRLNIFN
jgi:hypothetical protein